MDIDKVLSFISTQSNKDKKYLKGLFNKNVSSLSEQFGDALSEERINDLSLIKVGVQYEVSKSSIDAMDIELDKEEYLGEDLDDVLGPDTSANLRNELEEEDVGFIISEDPMDNPPEFEGQHGTWKDFMNIIPDPTVSKDVKFVKTPSLNIEIGPTYYLKMLDPLRPPFTKEFDGTYGKYNKHAFKMILIKVSDDDLYDEVYTYGDFIGKKAFVNGQIYSVWLDDRASGFMMIYWKKTTDNGLPDDRVFTFKKGKNGNKNVWTFGDPKG